MVESQSESESKLGNKKEPDDVSLIAFYLPQFHPIKENDIAWGKGFTEWFNVARAKPQFDGHYQPQVPTELGFYDLRTTGVLEQQAELARSYGVNGFCYYYYWFDGHRVLERPLDEMRENSAVDMPYCFCWANENWTRRWDGSEHEIIISQEFSKENWSKIIEDMAPHFADERYIRQDGKPVLLVYRPDIIEDLEKVTQEWRETAQKLLGTDLYLVACLTFGFSQPGKYGFDAAVEFPPHGVVVPEVSQRVDWATNFEGKAYDYDEVVSSQLVKAEPSFPLIRTAMAGWDNTPRRGPAGHIFLDSTPGKFSIWLAGLVHRVRLLRNRKGQDAPGAPPFVFINAWNEWAEGAHLEPDEKWGRQWLMACATALRGTGRGPDASLAATFAKTLDKADANGEYVPALQASAKIIQTYEQEVNSLRITNTALSKAYQAWLDTAKFDDARAFLPASKLSSRPPQLDDGYLGRIEIPDPSRGYEQISCSSPLYARGWVMSRTRAFGECAPSVTLMPRNPDAESYVAYIDLNEEREDLFEHYGYEDYKHTGGFSCYLDLRQVPSGEYQLMIGIRHADDYWITGQPVSIVVGS